MTGTDWQATGRKAAGVALTAVGIGAGAWMFLVLADVATFWYFYTSSRDVLQDYGIAEYAAKLVGVAFALLVSLVGNRIMLNMIKRNHGWVWGLSGLMAAWFLIMWAVASPYSNTPFNPFSGKPGKYYRDQFGTINKAPQGMKVGPNGEEVKDFDRNAAQEYERQHKSSSTSDSKWWDFFGKPKPPYELQTWVERIELDETSTFVYVAVRRADPKIPGRYYHPDFNKTYLVDENGELYPFTSDSTDYEMLVDAETHEPVNRAYRGKVAQTREIREGETYRVTSTFAGRLKGGIKHLRMYDTRFGVFDLDPFLAPAQTAWAKSEEIRLRQEAQKRREEEVRLAEEAKRAQEQAAEQQRLEAEASKPVPVDGAPGIMKSVENGVAVYRSVPSPPKEPIAYSIRHKLRVQMDDIRVLNDGGVLVTLTLRNDQAGEGAFAFALKEQGAGGMMDFYKFFPPKPTATLIDAAGRSYRCETATGFSFAREKNDWTILKDDREVNATMTFRDYSRERSVGPFTLNMEFFYGEVPGTRPEVLSITFADIRPR